MGRFIRRGLGLGVTAWFGLLMAVVIAGQWSRERGAARVELKEIYSALALDPST